MNFFGTVTWEDDDIESAFGMLDIEYDEADVAAIREICCGRYYSIQDAMRTAGWEFIRSAICKYTDAKEAIERRAREEGLR